MNQFISAVEKLIESEKNLGRRLDRLEEDAVEAEQGSTPELARILLLHADLLRGVLEQSRRRWMRLSAALSVALLVCLVLLLRVAIL